jgi:hypothetical protein
MDTLECRGNTQEVECEKLYLEATKKRNKLLDLDIEINEVELETKKVELKQLKGDR